MNFANADFYKVEGESAWDSARIDGAILTILKLDMPMPLEVSLVGVDPGSRNMGVAILAPPDIGYLFQVKLKQNDEAFERIVATMDTVIDLLALRPKTRPGNRFLWGIVEQAAYGALYGQATLAEVRTAAAVGLFYAGTTNIKMVTPAEIRKVIYGDGRLRSQELWSDLRPDAGSALGCALYAYLKANPLLGE